MVQTPTKPLTLDEFLQQPETKPACEYIDGQVIQKSMPQGQHSTTQGELVTAINAVTKEISRKEDTSVNPATVAVVGWALPTIRETLFQKSPKPANLAWASPELRCTFAGRSIIPDVAVFRWDRLPTNDDGTIANAFNATPDWTIEILSPDQSSTRVTSNILHCLRHGAQLGWLIDPNEQLVQVYYPDQPLASLEEPEDRLAVPDFAQGLSLTVGQLFGWLRVGG